MTEHSPDLSPSLAEDWSEQALTRAQSIKLLALDVDGVLTSGDIIYSATGDELKRFNIMDGLGIKLAQRSGVQVAIVTGRQSPLVARRARELGIEHLVQGREDKITALNQLLEELDMTLDAVAYIGDDLPDLAAIAAVGLGVTVANGHPLCKAHAQVCTQQRGGEGAVRAFVESLLVAQGNYESAIADFLPEDR